MNGKLFRRVLHLLLPTTCALCGAVSDETLCAACADQFFGAALAARSPRCRCCANPVATGAAWCGHCIVSRPAFDHTVVACDYALPLDQLVLQLKFGHRLALAALMARQLAAAVQRDVDCAAALPDLLCPVPLGPRRLAQRGYNQALEIARPLARSLGVTLHARLVARIRETAAQSSVAPAHRRANIAGAFALAEPALVRGRHVGVVDDVMTSGGTLDEMAAVLKRHGAARVSNFVFARTPPH
ncbi:amidophosphoribosyltransferase [Duganella sp. Leaf126]|uniref:ComF family protein n=1 Tax=Duganella sp. Leaf126 TaxID=1736266 RepID=UPI0006F1F396|nr:ComF family protein [Duganella sp. Leaf126]KQQ47283.1 amidophosphoribosyltransferase [Duganella sp. Leaf126]